jgi:hypothetical protein
VTNGRDYVALDGGDFRNTRRYLAPHIFFWGDQEVTSYPPPDDQVSRSKWEGLMDLPTDVLLRSTSWHGSTVDRLCQLHEDWISSWPPPKKAAYMNEPTLVAGEEFDALVFNAIHGWYRQAIGCLRNALEILTIAAALSARGDLKSYQEWRSGTKSYTFGNAREMIRDTAIGAAVELKASPLQIFGDAENAWMKERYASLCAFAHGRAGHDNGAIWQSNGPVFVSGAMEIVENEFRETLALGYLLSRIGWNGYSNGPGQVALIDGPANGWEKYKSVAAHLLFSAGPLA